MRQGGQDIPAVAECGALLALFSDVDTDDCNEDPGDCRGRSPTTKALDDFGGLLRQLCLRRTRRFCRRDPAVGDAKVVATERT